MYRRKKWRQERRLLQKRMRMHKIVLAMHCVLTHKEK